VTLHRVAGSGVRHHLGADVIQIDTPLQLYGVLLSPVHAVEGAHIFRAALNFEDVPHLNPPLQALSAIAWLTGTT